MHAVRPSISIPIPGMNLPPVRPRRPCRAWLAALGWVVLLPGAMLPAATLPFTPAHDGVVVARLRPSPVSRNLPVPDAAADLAPPTLDEALAAARTAILRHRTSANPRDLSPAFQALAPLWSQPSIPTEALFLRATLRQSLHAFDDALTDLDVVLARNPRHAAAWLTKATLHVVRAEGPKARAAATRLLTLADPLTSTAVIAQIVELEGQRSRALRSLESVVPSHPPTDPTTAWAATVLAEMLAREGRTAEAESRFQSVLAASPADPYVLGAYADLLLDLNRPDAVLRLLQDHVHIDTLLLRRAEARHRLQPGSAADDIRTLGSRFDLARERGDRLHLREEVRFHLRLLRDRTTALRLATENWAVQREPADARLLAEAQSTLSSP